MHSLGMMIPVNAANDTLPTRRRLDRGLGEHCGLHAAFVGEALGCDAPGAPSLLSGAVGREGSRRADPGAASREASRSRPARPDDVTTMPAEVVSRTVMGT